MGIQVGKAPADSNVLIEDIKIDESLNNGPKEQSSLIDKDKDTGLGQSSSFDPTELMKINYMTMMETQKYNPEFKHNLINLMNMGFMDFNKNVTLLQKHFNNLELVCSKIIEE